MRINGMNGMNPVYKNNKAKKSYDSSSVASGKDTLALSDFAKDLSIAKAAVSQTPDVREAKVEAIKKQMEAGTYNVTASQIADKLLEQI